MQFVIRLDDACEKMDVDKWWKMECLLDKYSIKPLVGLIPECLDNDMSEFEYNPDFYSKVVKRWKDKKWTFALHGLHHTKNTSCGGLNPINQKSEFAGLSLQVQEQMISKAINLFYEKNLNPSVFFAPFHTFDKNTLLALKKCTNIRIISDTIASKPYKKYGFTFVPQQSGHACNALVKLATFCFHPNIMQDEDFEKLDLFLKNHYLDAAPFPTTEANNKKTFYDYILSNLYFLRKKIKRAFRNK